MYALERYVDLDDTTKLDDVIKYNRVDCLALALLHQYLLSVDYLNFSVGINAIK